MTPKSKVRLDTRLNALAFADEPAVGGQRELPRPTPQNMYEGTPHPFLFSLNKEKDLICLTSQLLILPFFHLNLSPNRQITRPKKVESVIPILTLRGTKERGAAG